MFVSEKIKQLRRLIYRPTPRKLRILWGGLLCLLSFTAIGCSNTALSKEMNRKSEPISRTDFLLNTTITIQLYDCTDQAILDGCFDLIEKYERICSRTNSESELYLLNHGDLPALSYSKNLSYPVSKELSEVIGYGLTYSKLSGGAFDITLAPVTELWRFTTQPYRLPDKKALEKALQLVDYHKVTLEDGLISFQKKGIALDLGAIAKGLIADKVKEYLVSHQVRSAIINLGGNILCIGKKPDGTSFHIGIQKPYADRNETVAVIEINDLSVVSSGIYERYFVMNGTLYHHIINPSTGYPYDNNLVSVTIFSKKSVDGDGLSTTCFALGLEKGRQLIESLPGTYAVFITKDNKLHYTKGFHDAFRVVP